MKWLLIPLLSLAFATLSSCRKSNTGITQQGTLTGIDLTLCSCCGGIVLQLDGNTGNYRVDSLPMMPQQQLYSMSFPKRISFRYTDSSVCGGITRFKITSYSLGN